MKSLLVAFLLFQTNTFDVTVEWDPNTESVLGGYNVYRQEALPSMPFVKVNNQLIPCGPNDNSCTRFTDSTPLIGPQLQTSYDGLDVLLTWSDVSALEYIVMRNGVEIGRTVDLFWEDRRDNDGSTWTYQVVADYNDFIYRVTAVSNTGSESDPSMTVTADRRSRSNTSAVDADVRPAPPTNPRIREAGPNAFLEWDRAPVDSYRVYVDSNLWEETFRERSRLWRGPVNQQAWITSVLGNLEGPPSERVTVRAR